MTIYMTPNLSDEQIAEMDVFDAFRLGEELVDSRFPRDAARVLAGVVSAGPPTRRRGSCWAGRTSLPPTWCPQRTPFDAWWSWSRRAAGRTPPSVCPSTGRAVTTRVR